MKNIKKEITENKEIEIEKVNDIINLSSRILKVLFILLVFGSLYAGTLILNTWGFFTFLKTILKILSPFFIGIIIAWLLDPMVTKLSLKPKLNRITSSIIVYVVLLLITYLITSAVFPMLGDQINDFVAIVPSLLDSFKGFIDRILETFSNIDGLSIEAIRTNVYSSIEATGTSITNNLPKVIIDVISNVFSAVGTLGLGFIIAFYMLLDFNRIRQGLITFLPVRFRDDAEELMTDINGSLRSFVQGTMLIVVVISIVSAIAFGVAGLKAPLFFAIFCGLTNIIPYVGPYIGGVPAVMVGFTQSQTIGIITLIIVLVVQLLESNILHPIIMGKTMKLHPVTIIISLLIFFDLFGIVGMIVATPVVAALKILWKFVNKRLNLLHAIK